MDGSYSAFTELAGLEAAKRVIDARIREIIDGAQHNTNLRVVLPPSMDPSVLGVDKIGRIIRKRNISPEVREQRRKSLMLARQMKLDALKIQKQMEVGEVPGAPPATKAKGKGK